MARSNRVTRFLRMPWAWRGGKRYSTAMRHCTAAAMSETPEEPWIQRLPVLPQCCQRTAFSSSSNGCRVERSVAYGTTEPTELCDHGADHQVTTNGLGTASAPSRTGRALLLDQMVADGARYLFGNPGTVEEGFLDAL